MDEKLCEYSYIKIFRHTTKTLLLIILNISICLIFSANLFAQQDTVKIMPLGDSITFDLFSNDTSRTDGERIAYRYSLWQLLSDNHYIFDFVGSQSSGYNIFPDAENEGHGAVTDIWVANRVYNFLVDNPADVILLHIGTNSLDTNSADVEFLLDEIDRYELDYGKEVWVVLAKIINRTTYSLNTTLFNNNIEKMALARINDPSTPDKIKIVDMENGAGINYQLTPDGDMLDYLHPTPEGYTKIANLWYSALQTILPEPVDPTPQIISTPIVSTNIGESYSYDVEAVGDSIRFSLTNSPSGMAIDSISGLIQWISINAGEYTINVKAVNSGGEATQTYSLIVYDANDCPTGMVHHWRLDETTGAIYSDAFGTNDLLTNDSPASVTGKIDGAQSFDGSLNGLYTNDVASFQWSNTSDFTIEYWIKTPSSSTAAGNEVILGCDDAVNSTHWWAGIWSGGNAAFILIAEDGSGSSQYLTGTSDLTDGNWHHVVITRNGTSKINSLYVNGVLEDSITVDYTAGFSSTNIVTVGWLNLGGNYRFEGDLDDLGIYNTSISNDEILFHYTNGLAGKSYCDKFAPIIQSTPVTDIEINKLYQYDVESVGNSQPTYALTTAPDSMIINSTTGLIEWDPDIIGVYPVTISVSNSEGNTNQSFDINVTTPPPAIPPTITSIPEVSTNTGASYSYDVEASGDTAKFSLTVSPSGMTVDSTSGLIEWIPAVSGEFNVTVKASNNAGEDTQSYTLTVYDGNDCPTGIVHHWRLDENVDTVYIDTYGTSDLITNNSPNAVAGKINGAQQFDGSNDGIYTNSTTNFNWTATSSFSMEYWIKTPSSSTAAGNEIIIGRDDPSTSLHWWVGIWSGGKAAFVLIAEDESGNSQYLTGTSDLTDGNWHHVVITRDGSTNTNSMYIDGNLEDSKVISYTSGFNSAQVISVGWLNFGSKYRFEGSLDDVGIYNRTLTAEEINQHYLNGDNGYSFCDLFIPQIITTGIDSLELGETYSYNVNAIGNPVPTYSLTTSPVGMTINNTTGSIEWTPADTGNYSVSIKALNSEGFTSQNFDIQVTTPPPVIAPVITSIPIVSGNVGNYYSYDVEASGDSAKYSLTVSPAGMTVDSTSGLIEWTPASSGIFNVTVKALNSAGENSQSYAITIYAGNDCPTGIVHHWRLDENADTVYIDTYGVSDLLTNNSPTAVGGKIDGAQQFDGSNDGIYTNSTTNFNWTATSSFSIEYWMKTPSTSTAAGNEVLIGRDDAVNSTHWWAGIWSGGKGAFVLKADDGSGSEYLTGTSDLTDGNWHHVVVTRDGSTNTNSIFVDGNLEDSKVISYTSGFSSTAIVSMGWLDFLGNFRFEGTLDDIGIYNRALTTEEINQHFVSGDNGNSYCDLFAPIVYSTPLTTGEVDAQYTYDVNAAGNPKANYNLSVFPTGMTINDTTGVIQWIPTTPGTISVSVLVSNTMGTTIHNFDVLVEEVNTCPNNLTHYWKFDKRTSGVYSDSEGILDVEIINLPDSVDGIVNSALNFNGLSHEVYVSSNTDFNWNNNSNFTIAYWMKTPAASTAAGNEVIIGRDDLSNQTHWWSGIWSGGKAAFVMKGSDGIGGTSNLEGATDITDGQWHLIVITRDGVNKTNNLYVDGILEDSKIVSYNADITSTELISIGWLNLGGHYRFEGMLDELTYYSKSLSDYEVNNLYQNTKIGDNLCLIKAPAVNSAAITESYNGVQYNYKLDITGNPLPTLTIINAPAGMNLDSSTGTLTWIPDTDGSYAVNIQVENSEGIINHNYNLDITTQTNFAPYLTNSIADFSFAEDNVDSTIDLTTVFADSNLIENLTYSYSGDEFLAVNISSGKVYLTPLENWYGSESLIFTATDKESLTVSDTVLISVTSVNDAPNFTNLQTQTIIIDSPTDFNLAAVIQDVDNNIEDLTFSTVVIIGDGINVTIDNNLDLAHLLADSSGNYQIVFEAQDVGNAIGRDTLNITVLNLFAKEIIVNEGWNMISVPLLSSNMEKDSLFVNSASQAYFYKNGYTIEDTLKLGIGYWLKFSTNDSVMIYGINSTQDSITVYQGWNMVGPFYNDVSTNNLVSGISNNIVSQVYGFNNGYFATDILVAGYSYWIKVGEDDILTFNNSLPKNNFEEHQIFADENLTGSIIVKNNNDEIKTLNILDDKFNSVNLEIPPKPPVNIFDVRFSTNQMAENLDAPKKILISSQKYPITISVTNVPILIKDVINGEYVNMILEPNKQLIIRNSNITQLEVSLLNELLSYKLEQNYPNPFNPNTTINFSVPTESLVNIDVFDVLGQKIKNLVNEVYSSGYHKIIFDASDLATGVYFYKITSGSFTDIKKMLLIK